MVPIALQMGCETVMDAFNTPDIERFVNDMVAEEVIPMIDEDRDELKKFAAGILERFYNPFIKHMLRSISLNSLSKWEARNYPTVRDNWFKAQRLAEREAFTFAALMTLYGPNSGFEPDDTREFVDYICANWDSADMEATITKIVKESGHLHRRFLGGSGLHRDRCGLCPRHRDAGHERCLEEVFRSVTSQLFRCGVSDGSWHGLRSCSQVRSTPEPPPRRGLCGTRTCGLFY